MTRTLLQKLQYKSGSAPLVLACPPGLDELAPLSAAPAAQPNWLLGFAINAAELEKRVSELVPLYRRGGHLWFAYPKKSGRIKSDLDRDHGWDALTQLDLLPVTQVAIDADWSALRFRYRDEIAKLTRKF